MVSVPNLIIDKTSAISADGLGYPSDQGLVPGSIPSGGAGYGGIGGAYPGQLAGPVYGSALYPTDLGSGGVYGQGGGDPYGGTGGGAIRLNVSDTLTLDGKISANSVQGAYRGGGGSGGSIYITADKFEGSGALQANGANSSDAGGGGGRIAVYYNESTFGGSAHTFGGTGYHTMDLQPDRTERLFLLIQEIMSSTPGIPSGSRKMTVRFRIPQSFWTIPEHYLMEQLPCLYQTSILTENRLSR